MVKQRCLICNGKMIIANLDSTNFLQCEINEKHFTTMVEISKMRDGEFTPEYVRQEMMKRERELTKASV